MKREGRPTSKEILTMRLIDRPIRPLFPDGYHDEVQIMAAVLSADFEVWRANLEAFAARRPGETAVVVMEPASVE